MSEITDKLRAYFAGLTADSRPCAPGACPIVAAGLARNNAEATTLAPGVVRVFDEYTRDKHGALQWHRLTVQDIRNVLGALA